MFHTLRKNYTTLILILCVGFVSCNGQSSVARNENIKSSTVSRTNEATIFSLNISLTESDKINFPFYYHDSLYQGAPFAINKNTTKLFLNKPTLVIQANQNQTFYL